MHNARRQFNMRKNSVLHKVVRRIKERIKAHRQNHKVNKYMNKVLWFFILAGPAGRTGVFEHGAFGSSLGEGQLGALLSL